jgi:hypothetical protein
VLFYKYPAGGKPTKTLKGHGFYEPIGAAVERSPIASDRASPFARKTW